jgi:hypothetical protein
MDRRDIIDGLKGSLAPETDPEPQRGEHCLEPEELAAFLDSGSGMAMHSAHEAHLADCPFCLQQLSRICRSREEETVASVRPELLLQAEALGIRAVEAQRLRGRPFISRFPGKLPAIAAVAATVVLAVGVLSLNFDKRTPAGAAPEEFPATRYVDPTVAIPRLLAPSADSVIVPAEQVFRWTEVPGSLFYDVRLVDAEGEILLRERVDTTRWLIPDQLALQAGGEYYVRVDAYLDDERFLSSEHVVFHVRSEP